MNSPEKASGRIHNLPAPPLCRSAKENRSTLPAVTITMMAKQRKNIDPFSPIWRAHLELY
jgi:hypothetical protein